MAAARDYSGNNSRSHALEEPCAPHLRPSRVLPCAPRSNSGLKGGQREAQMPFPRWRKVRRPWGGGVACAFSRSLAWVFAASREAEVSVTLPAAP